MTSNTYPTVRLTRERAALVLVDHQVGLLLGVHDQDQEQLRRNVIALAKLAATYQLPVVATTSADDGPNGALLPELAEQLPGVEVIRRPGEIDAFDNAAFAAAVKATGRDQLIVAGISTDVCVTFAALSAVASGSWADHASGGQGSRVLASQCEDDVGDVTHRLLHAVDVADRAGQLAGHEPLHRRGGVPNVDAAVLTALEAEIVLLP